MYLYIHRCHQFICNAYLHVDSVTVGATQSMGSSVVTSNLWIGQATNAMAMTMVTF